jgi:hypothetical protein
MPASSEIESLRDRLQSTINERLLTVPVKKVKSLENMVQREKDLLKVRESQGPVDL